MGLLDRSLKQQGNAASSSRDSHAVIEPAPRKGLLARAESLRQSIKEKTNGSGLIRNVIGLFKRASAMREARPGGLLSRASAMREKLPVERKQHAVVQESFQHSEPEIDLSSEREGGFIPEAPQEFAPETTHEFLPEFAPEDDILSDLSEDLQPPPVFTEIDEHPSDEDLSIGQEASDDLFSLDGLEYTGNSPPQDDISETKPEDFASLEEKGDFEAWEEEAVKEAEEQAQLTVESSKDTSGQKKEFLFDDESQFITAPVEAHIASQKKIDNYLSLFDITKEVSSIDDFGTLWETILYAAMGQAGSETICIFSTTEKMQAPGIFYPVSHTGFELPEQWSLKPGDEIYDRLSEGSIKYAGEFASGPLSAMEKDILARTQSKILVPLQHKEKMYGIIFLGTPLDGEDYSIDDLEFLSLLGEMGAVGVDRVLSRMEWSRDTDDLRRRNDLYIRIFNMSRRTAGTKNLDELYDLMAAHLETDFQVESFSLVLLSPSDQVYRIFAGNQISPESVEKFKLGVGSDIVGMVSNLTRVYDLGDFRNNREITGCYTNDDLGLMQNYWIVPLINLNWLVGFITIHRTKEPWTEFHRELIISSMEILSPVFANCIILGERESLFRDPFSPLEDRLKLELKKAAEFQATVSLVDFRVKNIRRVISLNPPEQVSEFLLALNRAISGFLFETDFLARIGQGRFAVILPGRGREEAEIFVKKLRAEIKRLKLLSDSPVDIQYLHNIINAPSDTDEAGKMLAILE